MIFWPTGIPIALFMAWHEEPGDPGPSVVPSQVSREMIGKHGVVTRELAPVEEVLIDEANYEAVADFGVIGVGEEVVVRSQGSLRLRLDVEMLKC